MPPYPANFLFYINVVCSLWSVNLCLREGWVVTMLIFSAFTVHIWKLCLFPCPIVSLPRLRFCPFLLHRLCQIKHFRQSSSVSWFPAQGHCSDFTSTQNPGFPLFCIKVIPEGSPQHFCLFPSLLHSLLPTDPSLGVLHHRSIGYPFLFGPPSILQL